MKYLILFFFPFVLGGCKRAVAQSSPAVDYYDPRDYGAVGDGVTDDTAAFQSIANAITLAGTGGRVLVGGKGKRYKLAGQVTFSGQNYSTVILEGEQGTQIMFAGDWLTPGFQFAGTSAIVRNLEFVSAYPNTQVMDTSFAFNLSGHTSRFENCKFFGVMSRYAVIWGQSTKLEVVDTQFYGAVGYILGVVFAESQTRGVLIEDSLFIDYGTSRGTYYSKTGSPQWVHVVGANMYPSDGAMSPGTIVVRRTGFDEGAFQMLYINGSLIRIERALVEDNTAMLNVASINGGITANGVDIFEMRRNSLRVKSGGVPRVNVVQTYNCHNVELINNPTPIDTGMIAGITADAATGRLLVQRTKHTVVDSSAQQTEIVPW